MLKIPSKLSTTLSLTLSAGFFVICAALAVYMPVFTKLMVKAANDIGVAKINEKGEMIILALAYAILLVVAVIDVLLFVLLLRVRKELVFTSASVALIRSISWSCFLLAVVFMGLGMYFTMVALVIAFIAAFLGLVIRVVKNVIEEATEIKSESDLTV